MITQVFDFAAGSFSRVGDAATRGTSHRTAAPLSDGGVLLSGGFARTATGFGAQAERYDAGAAQWRTVGSMLHVRVGHTATLLRDGRVLIAGGLTCC